MARTVVFGREVNSEMNPPCTDGISEREIEDSLRPDLDPMRATGTTV